MSCKKTSYKIMTTMHTVYKNWISVVGNCKCAT